MSDIGNNDTWTGPDADIEELADLCEAKDAEIERLTTELENAIHLRDAIKALVDGRDAEIKRKDRLLRRLAANLEGLKKDLGLKQTRIEAMVQKCREEAGDEPG